MRLKFHKKKKIGSQKEKKGKKEYFQIKTRRILPVQTKVSTSAPAFSLILKKLAKTGRVVLFSIHQPSSEIYRLFDKIMLLSKGQQIFFGPSDSAVEFFQSLGFPLPPRMNPADHYLEVINRDFNERGQEEEEEDEEEEREKEDELISGMSSYFKRSSLFQKLFDDIQGADESDDEKTISTLTEAKKYETSFLTQLYYLCHRRLKINMIDFTVFWARFVLFVFMAIVIGSVYFQMGNDQDTINDRLGSLFYIVTFLSFMSISAFPAFVLEREIFIRERRNGYYTVLPYSLSHSLLCIPFLFAMTMSFSSICYYMVGFETGVDQFLYFCLVLYACLLIAEGIVMSISALAPNYIIGIIVAACIYGVFMLVGGYPLMSKYIPDYYIWIHYIVFQKYSFEGLLKNEFAGTSFDCDTYFNPASNTTDCICLHADLNQDCVLQGNEVLTEFGYEDVDKWAWLGVLFAMAFFFHTLFFFLLRFFNTGERK